jgi:hypothetical protein
MFRVRSAAPTVVFLTLALAPSASGMVPLPDLTAIDPAICNALVKTIGLSTDHRPMESAAPLGTFLGLEAGLEVTLSKFPSDLNEALVDAGLGSSQVEIPVIPAPKLHLKKGIGERVGIGVSAIFYRGYALYGGDIKYTLALPEEGPTWAIRAAYSESDIGYVKTRTLSPQLVVSRALEFADPYLGIGYQFSRGKIAHTETVGPMTVTLSGTGVAQAFVAFTGVQFRAKPLGLQLTLEGGYSSGDMHWLSTRLGFRF